MEFTQGYQDIITKVAKDMPGVSGNLVVCRPGRQKFMDANGVKLIKPAAEDALPGQNRPNRLSTTISPERTCWFTWR
jgi:hypothetical protein